MKERPQLHQIVLQWGTSEQEAPLSVKVDQRLPPLALKILNILRFVQDQIVPLLPLEGEGILNRQLVRSNDDVVPIRFRPATSKFFAPFGGAVVTKYLHCRTEALEFSFPVENYRCRNDDKVRSPYSFVRCQIGHQSDGLQCFPLQVGRH